MIERCCLRVPVSNIFLYFYILSVLNYWSDWIEIIHVDIFIGLNVIRVLSIIGLILVFSSSILVMVDDIQAVNRFMSAAQTTGSNSTVTDSMLDCDYIECVSHIPLSLSHRGLVSSSLIKERDKNRKGTITNSPIPRFRGSTVPNQPAGVMRLSLCRTATRLLMHSSSCTV